MCVIITFQVETFRKSERAKEANSARPPVCVTQVWILKR